VGERQATLASSSRVSLRSRFRPKSNVFFRRGDEYVIYSSVKRITLNQLFAENKKLYFELIEENAKIALDKYKNLYNCFNNRGSELFQSVFEILSVEGEMDGSLVAEIKNAFLLNIKRVEKAIEILKSENVSKLEIAERCGFVSSSNFYKTFFAITGKQPSSYVKRK
jgi:AraC-like DNA-binding protein